MKRMRSSSPPQMKKRFLKPAKDRCCVCGADLYDRDRYRVRLYLRTEPFNNVVFKELVVCSDCLAKLLRDNDLKKRFRIRYRKMRRLKTWF